jgi:DNA-binding NtrC family response regulator
VADFRGLVKASAAPAAAPTQPQAGSSYAEAMAEAERQILAAALGACNGRVVEAARRLGIGRATLYKRLAALRPPSPNRDASPGGDRAGKGLAGQPGFR